MKVVLQPVETQLRHGLNIRKRESGLSCIQEIRFPMGHSRAKQKHEHGAPQKHITAHQESIHRATLGYLLNPVPDPDRPGQLSPLFVVEQRQRARGYHMQVSAQLPT
jgi:hypothetical protein